MPTECLTDLLQNWSRGDASALDKLLPLVYADLKRMASIRVRRERGDNLLQTTDLVNEAYMRLSGQRAVQWENRTHFFHVTARLMRRVLVDHARRHRAAKRGGVAEVVCFDETFMAPEERLEEWLLIDDAISRFAKIDSERARLVELRYFAGFTIEEIAELEQRSRATVQRDWAVARSWLFKALSNRDYGSVKGLE